MRRPVISRAQRPLTFEVEAFNERGEALLAPIAGEHPLTLYVDKREVVTLMTLGQAPEALAIGYLRNQRLAQSLDEIAEVQVDWETDSAAVVTTHRRKLAIGKRTVTSGCGQGTVFGDLMEEIEDIELNKDISLEDTNLFVLLEKVRKHETIYKQAGAVHGCALATLGGEILMFVEDVGRHNAVDAIAGFMWLDAIDGSDSRIAPLCLFTVLATSRSIDLIAGVSTDAGLDRAADAPRAPFTLHVGASYRLAL